MTDTEKPLQQPDINDDLQNLIGGLDLAYAISMTDDQTYLKVFALKGDDLTKIVDKYSNLAHDLWPNCPHRLEELGQMVVVE